MDDKKHLKVKTILKVAGIVTLVAGVAFAITGFVNFFSSFGSDHAPELFWCLFVGLPLIGVGVSLCGFGFRREVTRYIKNESVPVINEAGEELKPAIGSVVKAINENDAAENLCPECGKPNDDGAAFCRHCGKPLFITCPKCGEKVRRGAFCDKCGAKLE